MQARRNVRRQPAKLHHYGDRALPTCSPCYRRVEADFGAVVRARRSRARRRNLGKRAPDRCHVSRLLNFDEAAQRSDAHEPRTPLHSPVPVQCSRLVLIAPTLSFEPTRAARLERHSRYFRHSPRPIETLRHEKTCKLRASTTRQRLPTTMSSPYGRSDHGR